MDADPTGDSVVPFNGTIGAASIAAFANLKPVQLENWETGLNTVEDSDCPYTLTHKTCGFVWKTRENKILEDIVCYNCGRK